MREEFWGCIEKETAQEIIRGCDVAIEDSITSVRYYAVSYRFLDHAIQFQPELKRMWEREFIYYKPIALHKIILSHYLILTEI